VGWPTWPWRHCEIGGSVNAVIVVDDVGAEHLDPNPGDQTAPWSYLFNPRVITTPGVIEVEPLPERKRKSSAQTPSARTAEETTA
jgi:hypothetical protein